ncbi:MULTISPECIES: HAD family hydrolase [unclassified Tolypothrix]|uniref:HAD family hydrolase n=1 Tax=unclassified Tolypothrix TaxID=2649714 RepID=UPI0005EAC312|nr:MULTISPECIES: HAD family phosphatase [unclassified Tolypothrix]BAY93632.1 HAD family hydrolase [Microchaete diplosiphon NIES-3275]EKE99571.1 HAD-superfamily hydrolase, subfamily IA, variant 3 [Tolypothrix sp. PCC 7601]MBE9081685.1 HAD family phosphatase [Tolypothrix sp. LEGE 11397]UYD27452.1 HAD family phosphatase [Tolypothrix sp. PCC 7712]UYD36684.1 HAD family phosphatase [Tolypothrix sp. PCC 7601]
MSLKAILFDFNGVIIKDEQIHLRLIDEILIQENLQPQRDSERQASLGRSDRACFQELLYNRGRVLSEEYLTQLLQQKAQMYVQELDQLEKLPLYSGVDDLIFQARSHNLKLGLVSGAIRQEIDIVLQRAQLTEYFPVIVAGDDITTSKPEPDGYLLAVTRLNQKYPDLNLQTTECLVIEDTPAGIQAAKRAQMQVVGVANTYPFHMLQRCCNWTVDYLTDLELERVQEVFSQKELQPTADKW